MTDKPDELPQGRGTGTRAALAFFRLFALQGYCKFLFFLGQELGQHLPLGFALSFASSLRKCSMFARAISSAMTRTPFRSRRWMTPTVTVN